MKDIENEIEELERLSKYADLLKNPDEFFRHMQGHVTELSLVLSAFEIANTSKIIIEALRDQLNNGWIPVSDRLPNKEECNKFDDIKHPNYRKFLCTIKIADYEPQTRELYFSKIFGWKYGPTDYNKYVIAWQPLPETYREGENIKNEGSNT